MENFGANNNSSNMIATGNQNMFGAGHQAGLVGYIPQGGPMTSLLHRSEELNVRGGVSMSFSGLIQEQHYSLLNGGRLVVELNIEGPRDANNNSGPSTGVGGTAAAVNDSPQGGQCFTCGKKKKESEDVDLNEIPAHTDEEYCECENAPMQVTGSMNPHADSSSQSSSLGAAGQTGITVANSSGGGVENHASGNRGGRSRRSRTRGTPRRVIPSGPGGPSTETLIPEPVTIAPLNVILPTTVSAVAPTIVSGATPFRIRDIVGRRDNNLLHTLFHPQNLAPADQPHHHHHQPAVGNISVVTQGQFVIPVMQSTSGPNGRDPRLNFQPIGNIHPGVSSHLQRLLRLHRANGVMDITDDGRFDGMRMDVEGMSYEQLLALGERIGAVNTGLSDEMIMERLPRRYYRVPKNKAPGDPAESCGICLADFENRDVLGKMNCTHKFHFECIKPWLKMKNFCPTCKETALVQN